MSAIINLFYLYDPWFFHFLRMGLIAGIVSLILLAYKVYQKKQAKIVIPIDSIIAHLILIAISIIPLLINQTKDFSVVLMYIKSFILFLFGIAIYNLFYISNYERFIKDVKFGIIIQAIIGFLALCGLSYAIDFALSTNVVLPNFYGSEQQYRLYNVTSSAFFQLSIFYLLLLHFYLAYNQKTNSLPSYYLFLILFIGVISGRTFFMLSALSILIYFKWRYVPWLILFGLIVLFFAKFYPENPYVEHAFEPIINLLNGGKLESSSTDTLMKKHLFMPEIKQLIMGDGYYFTPDRHYYGGSDSGFIRQALYGGICYSLVCFLFTAYFVKRVAENWFNNSWIFILSTLFMLSVLNIKADTYAFPGLMLIFLMFLSLFGNKGKQIILFNRD